MALEIGWGKSVLFTRESRLWLTHSPSDEILYHAQVHPEQYTDTLGVKQIKDLCSAIHYVCATSVDLLGNSTQFPTDWLFNYRWHKRKNAKVLLPNGDEVVYVTVGGRTSAIVPAVQKKTGVSTSDETEAESARPARAKKGTAKKEKNEAVEKPAAKKPAARKPAPRKTAKAKEEANGEEAPPKKAPGRKRKAVEEDPKEPTPKANTTAKRTRAATAAPKEPAVGLRRGRSAAKKNE